MSSLHLALVFVAAVIGATILTTLLYAAEQVALAVWRAWYGEQQ